jgi:hypothetical protein
MSENTITTKRDLKETLERIRSANSYDSAKLAYYVRKNLGTGKFIIRRDNSDSAVKTAR